MHSSWTTLKGWPYATKARGRKVFLILGMVLLASLVVASVRGQAPQLRHLFYGAVTIGGAPAPVGTLVTAEVEGVQKGSIATTASGLDGGPSALDDKLIVQDSILSGSTIRFFVDGELANETAAFVSGAHTELDLSVGAPPQPATPTPVPTATPISGGATSPAPQATATQPSSNTVAEPAAAPEPPTAEEIAALNPTAAASIILSVEVNKAAEIIGEVESAKAADIIEEVGSRRAAAIIQEIETGKAADIIQEVEDRQAAAIIQEAETSKAADIISEMLPIKAAAIMEELRTLKLTELVQAMPEEKLVERLPEVSLRKLSEIPAQVLFDKLPTVPVEQIAPERPPRADRGLRPPTEVQETPTQTTYIVSETGELVWATLVDAERTSIPVPIESILGKFARQRTEVRTTLAVLEPALEGLPQLPTGQVVHSLFSVTVQNADPEDLSSAYITIFVDRGWLDSNGIHQWSIQFNRFDVARGEWVPYPSKRVREDRGRIFYSVVSSSFSDIAITGSQTVPEQIFQVTGLVIEPVSPQAGQDIPIRAEVKNTGSSPAVYPASLWIDDTIEAAQTIDVALGPAVPFEFTISNPQGRYRVRVERLLGEFTVGTAPLTTQSPTPAPTSPPPVAAAEPTQGPTATSAAGPPIATTTATSSSTSTPAAAPSIATSTPRPTPTPSPTATPAATPLVATATPVPSPTPAPPSPKATATSAQAPVALAPSPVASPLAEDDGGSGLTSLVISVIAGMVLGAAGIAVVLLIRSGGMPRRPT